MTKLSKLDAELHDQLDVTANSQKRNPNPWNTSSPQARELVASRLNAPELLSYFRGRYDNSWRRLHA
ncbi:hypothetical protein [Synechococcus elongatus]|uniref:Antitoxin n=1 Tax=Synechococcus elongatus PCC 11802 TaxID=2283154 RepID=A0AAT9K1J6_SYNEL|nr:hypothetical protein [Synechococcus elongatus]QFZ91769.1 hypothetical protein EKO22_04640 [Synechococcus elongatus PCC 11802]